MLEEHTVQGSWSAPSQRASWDAHSGEVASGMILSAFPGPWTNPTLAGAAPRPPRAFFCTSNDLGGPWSTRAHRGFLKEVGWSPKVLGRASGDGWRERGRGPVGRASSPPPPVLPTRAFYILEL